MKRHSRSFVICLSLFVCGAATAQDQPQFPQPEEEHQWLKKFVGEWESKSEAVAPSGETVMHCEGTMSARMLGGFWLVSDVTGSMGETTVKAVQTIGYDPQKEKYVGTWVDSMVNHMWQYEGTVDESGKILTLEATGPNFMTGGKTTKFRDIYEFKSADHIVATSSMQNEDGEWVTFMTGDIKRKQ